MIKINELNAKNLMQEAKIKIMLFLGMFLAANTAAAAIWLCYQIIKIDNVYCWCLGTFLAVRVYLFMANPSMKLTDENVKFMSEQRIIWNAATIAIAALALAVFAMI